MTLSFPHNSRNPASRPAPAKTGPAAARENAPAKKKPPEPPRPQDETASDDAPDLGLFPRRIKSTEIIYTTSQLAVMVETGINLSAALSSIAEQEENPTLKAVLTDLKQRVEQGEDFSVALARHPKHFDKIYVALIKASEQTGALPEMLESISEYQRAQLETRQKVQGAMAYPAVMLVIAVGVTTFLLTFVLPKFTPLFAKKGVKLPLPTVMLMALSDAIVGYWPFWIVGIVAAVVGFVLFRRTAAGRQTLDWIFINLPLVGGVFRKVILSRSLRTLGTMVSSGVSMLDALRLSAEVSGNYFYQQAWLATVDTVIEGNRVCDSLATSPLFPKSLLQMLRAGEETGKLEHVLKKVSSHYDKEVDMSIKSTVTLLEPLMITVMGALVGGIALSMLLPIFSLSRKG